MSALDNLFGEDVTPFGKQVLKSLKEMDGTQIVVGFGNETYPDGTSVATVAMANEYGTSTIPARPFLSQTAQKNQGEIQKMMVSIAEAACNGRSINSAVNSMQRKLKTMFQQGIDNGNFAANAPSTVARKGSAKPLVDTGLMRSSIHVEVGKT